MHPATLWPSCELVVRSKVPTWELLTYVKTLLAKKHVSKSNEFMHSSTGLLGQHGASVHGITAEQKRRAHAEERLNLALLGSRQAIWDSDVETGDVYLSEHWEVLLGRPPQATTLPLIYLLDLVHPDDREGAAQAMLDLVKSASDEPLLHEHRVRHASGRWIWISSYGKVTRRAADGFVLRVTGINSDISYRKGIESELLRQLALAQAVIEAMPMPVAISSTDLGEQRTNRAWERQREEARVAGITDDVPTEAGGLEAADLEIRASGRPLRLRRRMRHPSGDDIELQFDKTPVLDEQGEVSAILTVTSDFTQLAAVERAAEAASRAKDDFLAMISHELRTPLSAIQGALDLLAGPLAQQLPEQARMLSTTALVSTKRLGRLIDDLLDTEKIKRGRLRLRLRLLDLTEIVRQSVEANQPYTQQFAVSLSLVTPPEAVVVHADRDRLQQVLTNLISNAARYSRPGDAIDVGISVEGSQVRVTVRDHGPGVAPEQRQQLFEKFAQFSHSTLQRGQQQQGLGLGLSISRALIEQHGGRIGYDNAVNGGALFWFELPRHAFSDANRD